MPPADVFTEKRDPWRLHRHLTSPSRHEEQGLHSERSEFMLLPVERTLRRRAPVDASASVRDHSEGGGLVWRFSSAVFLMRTTVRAAPQSTKAKVAPFHNFILERGGALKPCRDKHSTPSVSGSVGAEKRHVHLSLQLFHAFSLRGFLLTPESATFTAECRKFEGARRFSPSGSRFRLSSQIVKSSL